MCVGYLRGWHTNTYIRIKLGGKPRLSNPFILTNDIVILLPITIANTRYFSQARHIQTRGTLKASCFFFFARLSLAVTYGSKNRLAIHYITVLPYDEFVLAYMILQHRIAHSFDTHSSPRLMMMAMTLGSTKPLVIPSCRQ